jgi:hypothetical protein
VEGRRVVRSQTSDAVLEASVATPQQIEAADVARTEFGRWHTYSLFVNMATLALVTVVTGLAANLPERRGS